MIGGGVNDAQLMQGIANATQRPVIAGPTEATALGNALVQMINAGQFDSLASGRLQLRRVIKTTAYEPTASWDSPRKRFELLLER